MIVKEAIVLAALLHDIGKFMQRAEVSLSAQSKNMERTICPVYQGRYSHQHVLWTNEFFEQYYHSSKYPQFYQINEQKDNIANLASYHHRTETPLQMIIHEADCLSSGMDRLQKDVEDEITGNNGYKKTRLNSIFEKVNLSDNPNTSNKYRYELNAMEPTKIGIFPKSKEDLYPSEGEYLVKNYGKLWQEFLQEFDKLPEGNFDIFISSLLFLLEKYTWCIPSSTIDLPDISLFDHLKTTAAISSCLYEFHRQNDSLNEITIKDRETKKFLLVGGDLSGIQKYIFDLSHSNMKGASKILRARSFYISQLANVSTHYLLQEIGLPLVGKIIDAGGRFVLLVPNTKFTKEKLGETYQKISDWFRLSFAGELALNITWELGISGADFQVERFPLILSRLQEKIETKKHNRLQEVLVKDGQWDENSFILNNLYKYEKGVCHNCGKQPASRISNENDSERRLCNFCNEQENIGRWLINQNILAYSKQKPENNKFISFFDNKYYLSFLPKINKPETKDYYLIEKMYPSEGSKDNCGVKYLANYVPIWNSLKEFEELCLFCKDKDSCEIRGNIGISKTFQCMALEGINKEKRIGTPMLGILKADVDKLGFIFAIGLGRSLSISRYSTLSRELNLFFAGYLNEKLKKDYKNIYTIYAGGDDLLMIGDWETMIKFSKSLYEDFKEFTCHNSDITLSSGLITAKSNFPIRKAAEIADNALESSKSKGRDRFTFFDTTIEWDKYDKLQEFSKFLDDQLNDESSGVTRAFIYRLLQYHKTFLLYAEENKTEDLKFHSKMAYNQGLKFYSQMAYDVGRNIIKRDKKDKSKIINRNEADTFAELFDFEKINEGLMKNLKIPLFWVLYKNRKL